MLNVLKTWGVDTIYGIPSGTLVTDADALAEDKDIRFVFATKKLVLLQRLGASYLCGSIGLQLVLNLRDHLISGALADAKRWITLILVSLDHVR